MAASKHVCYATFLGFFFFFSPGCELPLSFEETWFSPELSRPDILRPSTRDYERVFLERGLIRSLKTLWLCLSYMPAMSENSFDFFFFFAQNSSSDTSQNLVDLFFTANQMDGRNQFK